MPLTAEQKKHNANIIKALLLILAGLVISLFVYRFFAKNYLQRVRKAAAADYPDAELVQLDEGASLFPDRVRAVMWDPEYSFLFVQDYRREGMTPKAEPEHPDSRARRLQYREACDNCIMRIPEYTDSHYLIRYDTDMHGFTVITSESAPDALNRLMNGLQSQKTAYALRIGIMSCPDALCKIIGESEPETVLKNPRLAIECGDMQQGEVMVLRSCADTLKQAIAGDWHNSLEFDVSDLPDGIPADYSAESDNPECLYAVTELEGITGQKTALLRRFCITR